MLLRLFGYFAVSILSVSSMSYPKNALDRSISSVEGPVFTQLCGKNEVCMNTFTASGAQCAGVPAPAPISDLILPFDKNTEVICTHSSGSGSH